MITSDGSPPSAETTWVVPPDRYEGGCATIEGANVLCYELLEGSRPATFYPGPS